AATFFGVKTLPQPTVTRELLKKFTADETKKDANHKSLRHMDLAMDLVPTEESAVVDFATHLLTLLGYLPRDRVARTRSDILLEICDEKRHAKTDVCIMDSKDILLFVQEDKRNKEIKDPEPQEINRMQQLRGQDPIVHKIIPGIILNGTFPVFYKVPVTTQLAQAVALGYYPTERTIVDAHPLEIARPDSGLSEGIRPLDNRKVILSCFEAFKKFVN
ncbi:hypothetical protein EDB92DRAFT_1832187, partial [Lactarius akahatsu]